MRRLSVFLLSSLFLALSLACGGQTTPEPDYAPLPPDKSADDAESPDSDPPEPSIEDIVFERRPGFVRVEGRWFWTHRGWVWRPGVFVAERPGYAYVQGRWDKSGRAWVWVEGHWIENKVGQVFRRGYWSDEGGRNVWVPGQWETRRPGYTFEPGRWEMRKSGWAWAPGRWRKDE